MFGAAAGEALPANWPDVSHWHPGDWLEGEKRFHLYTSGWIATSPTQDQYHDLYVAAYATEGEMMFSLNYGGFYVGNATGIDLDNDYEYWADRAKFGVSEAEVKEGVFRCQEIAQEYHPVYPWHSLVSVKAYRHNEGPDETFEWDYDAAKDDTGWFGMVNHANLGPDFAASNAFSFVNTYNPTDSTLDWGFKTEPFTLNVVTAQWLYESNVLNLIYEPLILHTPWELTNQYPWLAEPMGPGPDGVMGSSANPAAYYDDEWAEFETWYDPDGTPATGDERMAVTMRLRDDLYFTNGTSEVQNHQVTPEDVKFNCLFQRDSGPGVSYGHPTYALMEYIDIQADDPSLGPQDIKFYFGIGSFWLLYYAGYVGPLNMDLWMAANNNRGWGYRWPRGSGFIVDSWNDTGKTYLNVTAHPGNPCEINVSEDVYIVYNPEAPEVNAGPFHVESKYADGDYWIFDLNTTVLAEKGDRLEEFPGDGTGWSPQPPGGVDAYHPWEHDEDGSGVVDLAEDGTGTWVFGSWDVGNTILLERNPEYHKVQSSDEIRGYLIEAFHRAGNVNYEGALYESTYTAIGKPPDVAIRMTISPDGVYVGRAVGTDDTYPHGTGFNEYNEDCDFNRDGDVWLVDYILRFGMNYGKDAG
jgi:hypothetical protein